MSSPAAQRGAKLVGGAKKLAAGGKALTAFVAGLKPGVIIALIIALLLTMILMAFISFEYYTNYRAAADNSCYTPGSTGSSGDVPDQISDPGLTADQFSDLASTLRTEAIQEDVEMTPSHYLQADKTWTWSSENLMNAAIIINVGEQMGIQSSGIVIALATAMQELKLNNEERGDRDSVGLFQQRASTSWGKIEYIMQPHYAAAAFYNSPKYAGQATGLAAPGETLSYVHNGTNVPWGTRGLLQVTGWQEMQLTEAAQEVQRSGHPELYQQWRGHATGVYEAITGKGLTTGAGCNGIPGLGDPAECYASGGTSVHGFTATPTLETMCGYVIAQFHDKDDTEGEPNRNRDIGCIRNDEPSSGNNHGAGRACDFMTSNGVAQGRNQEFGQRMADFLVAHAEKIGVCMVIWYDEIWTTQQASEGWRPYSGGKGDPSSDHTNHVHVSVHPEGWQDREPGNGPGKRDDGFCGWNYAPDN